MRSSEVQAARAATETLSPLSRLEPDWGQVSVGCCPRLSAVAAFAAGDAKQSSVKLAMSIEPEVSAPGVLERVTDSVC